jgi:hypothetical protein
MCLYRNCCAYWPATVLEEQPCMVVVLLVVVVVAVAMQRLEQQLAPF